MADLRKLNDLMRAYYLQMLDPDVGFDVTIVGDLVGLAREITLGAVRASVASLDTKEGVTGAAADVAGGRSEQLRYMGEALDAALGYYEAWDEGDRVKINSIEGETGVAGGFGVTDDLTQRVVMSEDSPDVEALEIIDDWDESDRAKVNSIVGQAGVAGGAGAADALTQRVVAATDGPDVEALEIMAAWEASHDGAGTLSADGPQIMLEAVEFDGVVFPNVATEGRPVRMKALLSGVLPVKRVSEDGSQSIEDEVNNADRVMEIADARQSSVTVEVQTATTITAAETVIGGEINCLAFNTLTIWVNYTIGDETSYDIILKFLRVTGGDEHAYGVWSAGAVKAFTAEVFRFTASGKHAIVLDIKGINIIKIYGDATNGTPSGTSAVAYTLSNN